MALEQLVAFQCCSDRAKKVLKKKKKKSREWMIWSHQENTGANLKELLGAKTRRLRDKVMMAVLDYKPK